jgi:hypothetical protein
MNGKIREWSEEYGLDPQLISFEGWTLGGETMGKASGFSEGRTEIRLHRKLEGHGCAS